MVHGSESFGSLSHFSLCLSEPGVGFLLITLPADAQRKKVSFLREKCTYFPGKISPNLTITVAFFQIENKLHHCQTPDNIFSHVSHVNIWDYLIQIPYFIGKDWTPKANWLAKAPQPISGTCLLASSGTPVLGTTQRPLGWKCSPRPLTLMQ